MFALRLFRRSPGFSLLTLVIMALGIGATTAVFSLINGVLLEPLPFRDSGKLAVIWSDFSRLGGNARAFSSPADFFDWRERNRSFEALAAYTNSSRTLTAHEQPVTPLTHEVTANYFDVLGARAFRGRTFVAGEDEPGRNRVAMISYSLWRSAFDGSDTVVGSTVELDGQNTTIIGIVAPGFRAPNNAITVQPDLWLPRSFRELRQDRVQRALVVFGRLRGGLSWEQARSDMGSVAVQIAREHSASVTAPDATVRPIREDLVGEYRAPFFVLQAAVALMLLIACANVANLLLARYSGRARELALRTALGASRGRVLRQLLVESSVFAMLGGLLGIVFAKFSLVPLLALVPESAGLPFLERVDLSPPVLAFALLLSALTAVLFGLAPARQAFQLGLVETLKESGRSRSAGRGARLWRDVLIGGEVALSLVLLAGAALMIQSTMRLAQTDWGMDPSNILLARNTLRGPAYATPAARVSHFLNAQQKLRELPGVEAVSGVTFSPPFALVAPARFSRTDRAGEPGREPAAITQSVLPGYFETLRTPLIAGRTIRDADNADSQKVVVISQTLARRYFEDTDPVGRSLRLMDRNSGEWRIVGVVADVRSAGLSGQAPPILYFPFAQTAPAAMTFVIRTRSNPAALGQSVERTLWSLGRMMNVFQVTPLEQRMSESYWQSRFIMTLLSIFAVLAVGLAIAGVYGVISYLVSQRTREFGVRLALGARPADVLWMVTAQGLLVAATGVCVGLGAAIAALRALSAQLFGIQPGDPVTLLGVSLLLLVLTAAASAIPAYRAARVDPLEALRAD